MFFTVYRYFSFYRRHPARLVDVRADSSSRLLVRSRHQPGTSSGIWQKRLPGTVFFSFEKNTSESISGFGFVSPLKVPNTGCSCDYQIPGSTQYYLIGREQQEV